MPDPRDELAQAWLENDPGMVPPRDPTAGPRQMWQQGYASPQPTPQNQRVLGKGIGALMHGASEVLQIPDRMFEGARVERDPAATWQQVEQARRQQVGGATEAALNLLGTGAPLAATRPGATVGSSGGVLRGKPGGPWEGGIQVYHSSPHDFDKFDWSKLRTGEGANTYGAGFYFAENPAVSGQGGQYWNQFLRSDRFPETELAAAERLKAAGFDREKALAETQKRMDDINAHMRTDKFAREDQYDQLRWQDRLESVQQRYDLLRSGAPVGPRTYEVNINARPELMLDWDKPLIGHEPATRENLGNVLSERQFKNMPNVGHYQRALEGEPARLNSREPSGQDLYEAMRGVSWDKSAPEIASRTLAFNDIPGIRYLDQGSRLNTGNDISILQNQLRATQALHDTTPTAYTTKELGRLQSLIDRTPPQTYNYVVTDPSKLDILAKYGIVGGTAGGIGSVVDPSRYRETY